MEVLDLAVVVTCHVLGLMKGECIDGAGSLLCVFFMRWLEGGGFAAVGGKCCGALMIGIMGGFFFFDLVCFGMYFLSLCGFGERRELFGFFWFDWLAVCIYELSWGLNSWPKSLNIILVSLSGGNVSCGLEVFVHVFVWNDAGM